jgi:endo-1,4-beta-xylanase
MVHTDKGDEMTALTRRKFLASGTLGATALATSSIWMSPLFARPPRETVFRPYPHVQMPPLSFVYASDEHEDPFKSAIQATRDGIVVPAEFGGRKFSVNTRWYVEGFGYVWLAADNGGEYFTLPEIDASRPLNLNYEFARSRVMRNRKVMARYKAEGTEFSGEATHLVSIAEEFLNDAKKHLDSGERAAGLADKALRYALWGGETIELEHAAAGIRGFKQPRDAWFGCESRQFVWARSEEFVKRFTELWSFATVTHYVWDSWYELFEPTEGRYNWGIKDDIVNMLSENGITIQGRPLFWFHPTVTPDWLKGKNIDQLKSYVTKHTHDLVSHYGDKVLQWEVMNEYHDWANIHYHTPEQITEITRLALDTTKEVNPKVVRILNNAGPWAEYVARGRMARMDANRPLRSPRKFISDLLEAGVDFEVLGIQIYFPQRDLSDIARLLERLSVFGKPIYITEIGASSNFVAPNPSGAMNAPAGEPYAWHRHWDEELQADWLEQVYTMYYSRKNIKAINWYDFSDFRPFIVNGGLVREDCSTKQSFTRTKNLLAQWNKLPPGMKK